GRNLRVGLSGSPITGYTLHDGVTTYKIVPLANTTLAQANVFTGPANGLEVTTGAIATDSNSSPTNVQGTAALTLSAGQDFGGPTTV
ncbi:hypothetical protein SMA37_26505, partial [Escherichia coli]|uniref:hypothetical protein n=1 Tax=Escherichia coli TaxID=562 RepID=UPI003079B4F8